VKHGFHCLKAVDPFVRETTMLESGLDTGIPAETVRSELERILASPEFRASKRSQDFLSFVVERTLGGLPESLKERTIGIEVFGRPASYDTSVDGIVRINASEVRKRLAIHYADSNRTSQCRITLPVGSYIPVFSKAGSLPANRDPHHVTEPGSPNGIPASGNGPIMVIGADRVPAYRRKAALLTAAIVALSVLVSVGWFDLRPTRTIVDQFWQPLFDSSNPILIVPAYVPVYAPTSETPIYVPGSTHLASPPSPTPASNGPFTLLNDQYVGGGDLVAAFQLSSMLMQRHHPVNLRMSEGVSLDDLRNTPTVLIGYSSTQWSDVTNKFRFFVDDSMFGMVRDDGKPTDWYPHHETLQHHTDEDYAVISRAFDPETHSMLILVSGCLQYGTEGAARLITSSEQLSAALHDAPKGWQNKNLQLVIHFDVVANSPASSKVVASYYW
jgi:hypothetical protein